MLNLDHLNKCDDFNWLLSSNCCEWVTLKCFKVQFWILYIQNSSSPGVSGENGQISGWESTCWWVHSFILIRLAIMLLCIIKLIEVFFSCYVYVWRHMCCLHYHRKARRPCVQLPTCLTWLVSENKFYILGLFNWSSIGWFFFLFFFVIVKFNSLLPFCSYLILNTPTQSHLEN